MPINTFFMVFRFENNQQLTQPDLLASFVIEITRTTFFRCKELGVEHPIADRVVRQQVKSILSEGGHSRPISLHFEDNRDGHWDHFTLAINFDNPFEVLIIIDDSGTRWIEPSHYELIRAFVYVFELFYRTMHPVYGYGPTSPDFSEFGRDQAEPSDIKMDAIYAYNFLGPQLRDKIGRAILLTIPTWRTVFYQDGGVLLEMSPHPIGEWTEYEPYYQAAVRILGLERYSIGG